MAYCMAVKPDVRPRTTAAMMNAARDGHAATSTKLNSIPQRLYRSTSLRPYRSDALPNIGSTTTLSADPPPNVAAGRRMGRGREDWEREEGGKVIWNEARGRLR